MNALVTVNVGNIMHEASRSSFKKACSRWGVEYVELIENKTKHHPSYVKLQIFDLTKCDNVFFVDADCLISPLCPNPFLLYDKLAVVYGAIPRLINYKGIKQHIANDEMLHNVKIKNYFNSGVMFLTKEQHAEAFTEAQKLYRDGLLWHDQTPLNIALADKPTIYLDETWNYIPQSSREQNKFIYHFAGYKDKQLAISEWVNYEKIF